MATPKVIADFTTQLTAKMAVGATTGTVLATVDDDGVTLPTGTYFFTIDGNNSAKEHIRCTYTAGALTSVYSVSRQGAVTSGTAREHRVGATVVMTDFATYKNYIDEVALAGASDATTTVKGIAKLSATPAGDPIAVATEDTRIPVAYAVDAAGSDSYAITPSPAITAYAAGQSFTFKAGTANTGAATLNVNGLGAKTLKKNVADDLETGDIAANQIVKCVYDGTNMQVVSLMPEPIVPVVRTYLNAASPATWSKPAGLKYIVVEVQAGGGGGGGADASTGETSAGNGGGAGAYSRKVIAVASLGSTETVTIGAGGGGGASSGGNGSTGGTSSFGSHVSCTGGSGGPGDDANAYGSFASGGTATGGDLNVNGGVGQPANDGSTSSAKAEGSPGQGAASYFGGGANGTHPYGAGGGGAYSSDGASSGTTGADGIVIVTEYY